MRQWGTAEKRGRKKANREGESQEEKASRESWKQHDPGWHGIGA